MNEYPKTLYHGGDVEADCVLVWDAAEELVKRESGYQMAGEEKADPAPDKPKRGRPRKVE